MTKRKPASRGPMGNPRFKGRGAMLCYVCDAPIRDHTIFGPCPAPVSKNPRMPEKMGRAGGQQKK